MRKKLTIHDYRLWLVALIVFALGACSDQSRESAAVPDKDWDNVYRIRDQLASGEGGGGATASLQPTGWATISGKFLYDATSAPSQAPIIATKDAEVCGVFNLRDESLVVDPDSMGLANVFIFLRTPRGFSEPHPSYSPDTDVTMSNKGCRFEPHVLGVWLPQTLRVTNDDPVAHNANCTPAGDSGFNEMLQASGGELKASFGLDKTSGVAVTCTVHTWMRGWVIPRDNPYFATTDAEGNFRIENVPAGIKLEFQVWHERSGPLNADATWRRGRFSLELAAGEERILEPIKVNPNLLNK
ncbi:MAG: hypothetical protein MPJ50_07550 [Pirellulales bacterium]|nr:hypothetical protein [Pirellulales bacterium]